MATLKINCKKNPGKLTSCCCNIYFEIKKYYSESAFHYQFLKLI